MRDPPPPFLLLTRKKKRRRLWQRLRRLAREPAGAAALMAFTVLALVILWLLVFPR